jgi:hypothetical protein
MLGVVALVLVEERVDIPRLDRDRPRRFDSTDGPASCVSPG